MLVSLNDEDNMQMFDMRKFFAFLAVPLALFSCSKQYIIQGNSTVQSLDGKMLYLKTLKDNQLVNVDSCEVIHGQFEFSGTWDSTMMVNLLWMMRVLCLWYSKKEMCRSILIMQSSRLPELH